MEINNLPRPNLLVKIIKPYLCDSNHLTTAISKTDIYLINNLTIKNKLKHNGNISFHFLVKTNNMQWFIYAHDENVIYFNLLKNESIETTISDSKITFMRIFEHDEIIYTIISNNKLIKIYKNIFQNVLTIDILDIKQYLDSIIDIKLILDLDVLAVEICSHDKKIIWTLNENYITNILKI